MNNQDTDSEPSRYQNQTREDKKSYQALIPAEDWPKMVGKTVVSKDGLDMGTVIADDEIGTIIDYPTSYSIEIEYGDHERISIPKDTIYKFDHKNLYTSLTENEILASRKDDPFSTSIRSYTRE
jgi:hypothetical protein